MARAGEISVDLLGNARGLEVALNKAGQALSGFGGKLQSLGKEAQDLLGNKLVQALSLGAILAGVRSAFVATDQLEQSQRTLASTAQITGASLRSLYQTAETLRQGFQLDDDTANKLTETVTRLTAQAGRLNMTQEAAAAFLELGAARGFTAEQTMEALENAYVGVYRGAQKLIGQNVGELFQRQAAAVGKTATELSESEKAQILLNAAVTNGAKAQGSYAQWLETAAGQQQKQRLALNDAQVALGRALQPLRLLAIQGFAFVLTKVREFIGGIQLIAAELGAFSIQIDAFWKDFGARALLVFADVLTGLHDFLERFGIDIGEGIVNKFHATARRMIREAGTLRRSAREALAESQAEITADFNQPPPGADTGAGGGGGAPGTAPTEALVQARAQLARQLTEITSLEKLLGGAFDESTATADALRNGINSLVSAGADFNTVVGPQGETLGELTLQYRQWSAAVENQRFSQERQNEIQTAAKRLYEETRTPLEMYNQRVSELDVMLAMGAITMDTYTRALQQLQVDMQQTADVGAAFTSGLSGAFTDMAASLGTALAEGENVFAALGKSVLRVLGGLLQQVGQTLIAFGTAGIAIKAFISNPFLALAAGAALVALGAALAASASRSVAGAGRALAGGGGLTPPAEPRRDQAGAAAPETQVILEFQDPSNPAVVQRIVASANRLHSRDATPVVSVPLAVVGTTR